MTINFSCSNCGQQMAAPDTFAGQERPCAKCKTMVLIPGTLPPPAPKPKKKHDPSLDAMKSKHVHSDDLVDMTAMVDIVFFLLIFFMVTSIQALESVISLPQPESSESTAVRAAPAEHDPSFVDVVIDSDDKIWIEDEEVYGEQNVRAKLRAVRREDPNLEGMTVIGNPDATHGTLVMVLDAGADAGMERLRFSVKEHPDYP